jgi:outer membrane protein TolC
MNKIFGAHVMRNRLFVFLIILTVQSHISAQGETLSLERARELALLNSRSLAGYNLGIQGNLLTQRTQNHNMLPNISLGASAYMDLWNRDGFVENPIQNSNAGASLTVTQSLTLYDGGKQAIMRAINSLNTEMSRQDAMAEFHAVLNTADSLYYSVLEATAALEAAEGSLATANLSFSMAEIRHANGMISEAAFLQVLAERAGRETARNQSRRDLALARLRLREFLGIDEVPLLEPIDMEPLEDLIIILSNLDDSGFDRLFTVFRREIQTRNPSFLKASLNSERSGQNVTLAERNYFPTLSASLSAGMNYSINNGLEPSGGRLSITANIPLDIWAISANVERQRNAQEQAAMNFRSATSSLDIEISTILLDLISHAGQILSSRQALNFAMRHFDHALELYRLARSTPTELSDAETLVRNSRNQLNRSQYAFLSSLSRLRSAGVFNSEEEVITMIFSVTG